MAVSHVRKIVNVDSWEHIATEAVIALMFSVIIAQYVLRALSH